MSESIHNPSIPSQLVVDLAGQAAARAAFAENPYAHLLDPNAPDPGFTVEDAAVRPSRGSDVPAQTSHRVDYWLPPTQAQIDKNPDLAKQEKYFPPGQRA